MPAHLSSPRNAATAVSLARRLIMALLCLTPLLSPAVVAAPDDKPTATRPQVQFHTNLGDFTVELDPVAAPKTVDNFLQYVHSGHYNGAIFHRVINNFMIQGGGFDTSFVQKPARTPILHEGQQSRKAGLRNTAGTIAMARRNDPHSATAQFFINHRDNAGLDFPAHDGWGYAVFGKVTQGMDVVDKIAKVPTGNRGFHQNVPLDPVVIQSVKILSDK